jgi:lysyl-tRNA synthetase class 2
VDTPDRLRCSQFAPAATWERLRLRAALLRRLRRFFDSRGFLEVETPLLSAEAAIDRHIDPLSVTCFDDPRSPREGRLMFLQPSPELGMKRLLAAGGQAIYQTTRAFRGGECGAVHNPEFTIVEWYRAGDTYDGAMGLLAELAQELLGADCVEKQSYRDAFLRHVGADPHRAGVEELSRVAAERGLAPLAASTACAEDQRDVRLDQLFAECIQPRLGQDKPTMLYDYPASQAAQARVRDDDPPVAERFELYVRGIELANGYHELLDAGELLCRWRLGAAQRAADGKFAVPGSDRLIAAMEHGLPPSAGVALGFDRLVMVAAGADGIADVMTFPIDRA